MHPAPSLIAFTVLSGLGLGLAFWLGLGIGPSEGAWRWWASGLALGLIGAGGLASVGHLANRRNAWRAFSQWRSSWLSREACFLAATMALFGLHAALWCLAGLRLWGLGLAASAAALATVHCTAMIYAQLRTVPRWSAAPTPALFWALALAGGLLAAGAVRGALGVHVPEGWVLVVLVAAAAVAVWWQTVAAGAGRGSGGSSMGTATGLARLGRVRLLEAPHTGTNYLLREMAFEIGRRRAFVIRRAGAALGFLLPMALTLLSWPLGDALLAPALVSHVAGMLALRWLFFAEAEHVQALYYGHR